jgi:predicted DNA-binding transcriptional regulator YafY
VNRTDRLYAMVEMLRASAPRPVSGRRMAERFEVSVRTVERDISALQQSGVPIYAEPGRTGGYVLDRSATLPPLNMTPEEATAIAVALAHTSDSPFAPASRTALAKVLQAMSAQQSAAARDLVGRVRLMDRTDDVAPRGRAARTVTESVVRRLVVEIGYADKAGTVSRRQVEPVGLLSGDNGWYLIGWCRLRDDGRAFRIDRVTSATLTTEPAPPRAIEDLVAAAPGLRVRVPELA